MCGRYNFNADALFFKRFNIQKKLNYGPNFNITPGSSVPVVVRKSPNQAVFMKWGLIPYWAKDPNIGYRMINARVETIQVKPSFSRSLKLKRCLVPANGFYEWKKTDQGSLPFYITFKNRPIFAFAGLYDSWENPEGKEIQSYTIITTNPNKVISPIHNRMPAILDEKDEDVWLDPQNQDSDKLVNLLQPNESEKMLAYPISKKVNNPSNNDKSLILPKKESVTPSLFQI